MITHKQYYHQCFDPAPVCHCHSLFPDEDTQIGVQTLESQFINVRLEKVRMSIASQSIPSHKRLYKNTEIGY